MAMKMIERQNDRIYIECAKCPDVFVGAKGAQIEPTLIKAKLEGWVAQPVGNDLVHTCPACGVDG